ncbi:MAG TPA: ATP synthase F1 subunit delta [Candidatus Acidoferrales bacterium]|nr:ATP synthase F1 subunit delta [Candidatus Acidoferrales bacterium]
MRALADRYAAALLDVVMAHGLAEPARASINDLGATVAGSANLRAFIANPSVQRETRIAVMESILDRLGNDVRLRPFLQNFLLVILDHRRVALLPEIAESFRRKLNERLGIAEAQVESAAALDPKERADLEQAFAQVTQKKIAAEYSVDPALVAGAVVRIGSVIYDGSVREQLRRLEKSLAAQ